MLTMLSYLRGMRPLVIFYSLPTTVSHVDESTTLSCSLNPTARADYLRYTHMALQEQDISITHTLPSLYLDTSCLGECAVGRRGV